ncbi:hypothetical protein [Gordonia sp. (in: high G+C Gram-positive bacteria)]|uniref:hypothetical protein n=1 Tax=Gordonia sp. (in: high G+C Gram-positive bacteria) TaxID=84139 RepID=UPI0033423596
MTDPHQEIRDIAALTILQKRVTDALAAKKAALADVVVRGTLRALVDPTDPLSPEFGRFEIPTPTKPKPSIVDEDRVVPWALAEFGEVGIVELRLSQQGRKSVVAAAERGVEVPGVEWSEPRAGAPRWVPAKGVDTAFLTDGADLVSLVAAP